MICRKVGYVTADTLLIFSAFFICLEELALQFIGADRTQDYLKMEKKTLKSSSAKKPAPKVRRKLVPHAKRSGLKKVKSPEPQLHDSAFTKPQILERLLALTHHIGNLEKDNNEYRNILDALVRDSAFLDILLDNVPDAIYFKDIDSRIIRVNRWYMVKYVNGKTDTIVGKTDFDLFTREHASEAFKDEQKIISSGKPLIGKIERETYSSKSETWVSTTKVPIHDADGKVIGTCGISRDITANHRYEEELQKSRVLLEKRLTQINFLNKAMHDLSQFISVENLYPEIIAHFISLFPGAEAALCEYLSNDRFLCVNTSAGIAGGPLASKLSLLPLAFHVSESAKSLIVASTATDDRFSDLAFDKKSELPVYLLVPLVVENRISAVIQLFVGPDFSNISLDEKTLLSSLAAHAAICLSNARYYHNLSENARLAGEIDAARRIQRRFIPQRDPAIPRVNLRGEYFPAFEVSGDYLDYFKTSNDEWVVVIADVCGKGIPAALLAAMLRTSFRSESRHESSPRALLAAVNENMHINLEEKTFVSAMCIMIDKESSVMRMARAGHPHMLMLAKGNALPKIVPCDGLAMGVIFDRSEFCALVDEVTIPLNSGDRFFIYTDGLPDAVDPQGKRLEESSVLQMLSDMYELSADAIIDSMITRIKAFTHTTPLNDDLTMLALEVR